MGRPAAGGEIMSPSGNGPVGFMADLFRHSFLEKMNAFDYGIGLEQQTAHLGWPESSTSAVIPRPGYMTRSVALVGRDLVSCAISSISFMWLNGP